MVAAEGWQFPATDKPSVHSTGRATEGASETRHQFNLSDALSAKLDTLAI